MTLTSSDAILRIVDQNANVSAIHVFEPTMSPPIQDDASLSFDEQKIVQAALELRSLTDLPFWDSVLLKIASSNTDAPALIAKAQRHNPQCKTLERIERAALSGENLARRMAAVAPGQVLALSSKVACHDASERHIPLIDFHCKTSPANDGRVRTIAEALGLKGYIAHSGQSYHFLGSSLLESSELILLLGRALLFAPIIDRAWIAHQILEGAAGLRISPGKTYKEPPKIIDQIV
jgi:hypothetical protein